MIFDTETTGLISNHLIPLKRQPELIEFYGALVNLESGDVLKELHAFVKPAERIPDEVIKITHITNEMVADKPPFKDYADSIKSFIEESPQIIAHNASYDKEIMDFEFERMSQKLKWPRLICSVEQTIFMKGYRLNLQSLHMLLFKENFVEAHRAINDAKALIKCCVELYRLEML